MKKVLFFLGLFLLLFAPSKLFAFQYYNPTHFVIIKTQYNFKQLKTAAQYFAKKGGIKLIFLNKSIKNNFYCDQRFYPDEVVAIENACKMLYYDNSWFKTTQGFSNKNIKKPILTKKTYRYMLINFLNDHSFEISIKNPHTIYAFWKGQSRSKNIIKYIDRVQNPKNKPSRVLGKVFGGYIGTIPYPIFVSLINKKYYNPITNTASNIPVKNIKLLELKKYERLALADLRNIEVQSGQVNTYGLSKDGLKTLVFNIASPNYYKESISTLQQILQFGTVAGVGKQYMPGTNTSNFLNLAKSITPLSNINNSVNATLNSIVSKLNAAASNRQALYGNVTGYYSSALTAKFGQLKTSFLTEIGVGANIDISYNTILMNSNLFLDKINNNQGNLSRFKKLFNKKFAEKWDMKQNYVPTQSIHKIEGVFASVASASQGNFMLTPLNYGTTATISELADYPVISTKSVNFYSFIYYLMNDIYFKTGYQKRTAKKIFRYIVLSEFNKALKSFYSIPATVVLTKNENKIEQAVYYINHHEFNKAESIIADFGSLPQLSSMNNRPFTAIQPLKSVIRAIKIFVPLEMLFLIKKYQTINVSLAPWQKVKKQTYFSEIKHLRNQM